MPSAEFFTIGYGGRLGPELVDLLRSHGVKTVADVRLRPDRASMGIWIKAKDPDKGIQALLSKAGLRYHSFPQLGNAFLEDPDWKTRYSTLIDLAGGLLTQPLLDLPRPFCLLCAEKKVQDCHRLQIAEYLVASRGMAATHIE